MRGAGSTISDSTPLLGSVNNQSEPTKAAEDFDPSKTYSHLVAVCFGLNYVVGTGLFSLPYAFYNAGWQLAGGSLVIFALVGTITSWYTLEFLARAEGIRALDSRPDGAVPVHRIGYRQFDFVQASEMFGGAPWKLFTQTCVAMYCYGALWSYAAVFASSASTLFFEYALSEKCNIYASPSPGCHLGYYVIVLLFGSYAIAVSLRDISGQKTLQLIMTVYRFAAFGAMLCSAGASLFKPNAQKGSSGPNFSEVNHVQWTGFGTAFTFSAVALNQQYNVPDYIAGVQSPKGFLKGTIGTILALSTVLYVAVGYVCALAFGSGTLPLSTLNWNTYTGRDGGWGHGHTLWWATIVKLFVMLFPLLNMLSVYPLVVVTLAGNLQNSLSPGLTASLERRLSPRGLKIAFRLLAAVPPLCASMYSGKLNTIFTVTGLIGFFLELIIPSALHVLSARMCVARWGPGADVTPYTTAFSHSGVAWTIAVVGSLSFLFAAFVSLLPTQARHLLG